MSCEQNIYFERFVAIIQLHVLVMGYSDVTVKLNCCSFLQFRLKVFIIMADIIKEKNIVGFLEHEFQNKVSSPPVQILVFCFKELYLEGALLC